MRTASDSLLHWQGQLNAHLALTAFFPAKPLFPLLQMDNTCKFREIIQFSSKAAARHGMERLEHANRDGIRNGRGAAG